MRAVEPGYQSEATFLQFEMENIQYITRAESLNPPILNNALDQCYNKMVKV